MTVMTNQRCSQCASSVSVLLPAWNEGSMIRRSLDSLTALDWPDLEIIVCAGGSDGTLEIAKEYASERVIVLEQQPGEGKQSALRRSFGIARGDIIFLSDADCVVPDEVFHAVIEPVVRGEVAASTGTSRPVPEQYDEPFALYQWSIRRAAERRRSPSSSGLLGRNCAVRRDAVVRTGSFSEDVAIGTDYHLAKMLLAQGDEIRFVPAAVLTPYPVRPRAFLRQQSRWLRNIFLHGIRFGDYNEMLACSRTIAVGLGFYAWPLSWRWTRIPGVAIWLAALGYLMTVRIRYVRLLADESGLTIGPGYFARLPWYTLLDVLAWLSPIVDAVSPRRRLRW